VGETLDQKHSSIYGRKAASECFTALDRWLLTPAQNIVSVSYIAVKPAFLK
jgi:hypothetical protein